MQAHTSNLFNSQYSKSGIESPAKCRCLLSSPNKPYRSVVAEEKGTYSCDGGALLEYFSVNS